ncbi:ferritin [Arthrobacter sp. MYb227]|uniref:ferritin n=1 Tax=Arthrobacter sp. MYb227 TaxID=1848601 RepID=UPI000CFB0A2E|nr:ferritin [Arthrobacter sp. MYb227]PQZ87749.1 ferritin [Arthrobacter sp. MYb227]
MELTGKLADAFNDQITLELHASTVYRQLSIEMDALSLSGIAGWFRAQAAEELEHAEKFIAHVIDRSAHPVIGAMAAPSVSVSTVEDAFEISLGHEKKVSEAIRDLYRLAQNEGDIDSIPLLHWFIEEQVEEEATVGGILERIKMINNDGNGLLRLDAELAAR